MSAVNSIERMVNAIDRIKINNEAFKFGFEGKDADGLDMQSLYDVCLSEEEKIIARRNHHMGTESRKA